MRHLSTKNPIFLYQSHKQIHQNIESLFTTHTNNILSITHNNTTLVPLLQKYTKKNIYKYPNGIL